MKTKFIFLLVITILTTSLLMPIGNVSAAPSFQVYTYNTNRAVTTNSLSPNIMLVNTGNETVNLEKVKILYYFTNDGPQSNGFSCDYATVGSANVTATFVNTVPVTNADRYCEIGFTSGAGSLSPGQSVQIYTRMWKSDWSNFNQSNDLSFNAFASFFDLIDIDIDIDILGIIRGHIKIGGPSTPPPPVTPPPPPPVTPSPVITPRPT